MPICISKLTGEKIVRKGLYIFISGIIFYLFIILNYPILDTLINQAKAANSLDSFTELKCEDLFLSYTIKTHNWNVLSLKSNHTNHTNYSQSKKSNPSKSSNPSQEKSFIIYVVKRGDTLWKISQKYGVNTSVIYKLNNLKRDTLSPNMRLKIMAKNG